MKSMKLSPSFGVPNKATHSTPTASRHNLPKPYQQAQRPRHILQQATNGSNRKSNSSGPSEQTYSFTSPSPSSPQQDPPSPSSASSSTSTPNNNANLPSTVLVSRGEIRSPLMYQMDAPSISSPPPPAASEGDSRRSEGDKKLITTINNPAKTTGLRRAPLSGGVKTATVRYSLPSPAVAVRNLVEQAHFAHLCTVMSNMHHRRAGYPFGTLVDFASDGAGLPIFCLSPLAIHARNIVEDSRCSLVVQMPGWTGLANARVTIFGDVYQLPQELQEDARNIFLTKHSTRRKERWVTGNFMYFRMHRIVDIYFVGGFGTVQWIDPQEFINCKPDAIVLNDPHTTLQVLNETFGEDLRELCYPGSPADDASFISIDASGADIKIRHGSDLNIERIGFAEKVHTREDAVAAVRAVLQDLAPLS